MINDEQFVSFLSCMESEVLDFKAREYDLANEDERFSLVKDVLCMANTPRDSTAFIVLGVKKHPNGTYDLWGVKNHPDEADLQSQFAERVHPIPSFTYEPVKHKGHEFGVIAIPPVQIGPCVPLRDYGNVLRQWQVYFRRGSKNDVAQPDDTSRILSWFGKKAATSLVDKDEDPSWDQLLREVQNFEPVRHYVLFISPCTVNPLTDLEAMGRIPWAGVFDFDPESDFKGALSLARPALETHRSIHLVTAQDRPTLNLRTGSYWYFARGLAGREGTIETGSWQTWKMALGASLTAHITRLAAACAPTPVTCLAIWYDASLVRHLRSALEAALESFGDTANIVVVTDDPADLQPIAAEISATLLEIPLHQLCSGISSFLNVGFGVIEKDCPLPSSSGAPVPLPATDRFWLEEELDIVHLAAGLVPPSGRSVGREFLRGAEVSWYELGLHYDGDRDLSEKLERRIRTELKGRRTSRINLYHAPGAGGTTVARRLLWDFHRSYPCAIIRRTTPADTAERLFRLTTITGLPILLLVDGADVAERQIDELYDYLRSRHIPATLLQVLRRFTPQTEGPRAFYLRADLSKVEAERFAHIFTREVPHRKPDIDALVSSPDSRFRSAFYFGLHTFRDEFLGLEPFVAARLKSLTSPQKKVLGFLALAHHYAQRPLPVQLFAEVLGLPRSRSVALSSLLLEETLDLLVQVDRGTWRTAHDLIAQEILEQLLWPGSSDRRLWKQNLSSWSIDFAELCRGSGPVPSEDTLEIIRRTFIYRDNVELLGTERAATTQFAQLIQDIPSAEGSLQVFQKLTELYPEEAHFWAHLGRFYSVEMRRYEKAIECIERALSLDPDNSVLHHVKGMALRHQVYEVMEHNGPIPEALIPAKDASASFVQARDLNPDDEHGYISEVQMLARILDYAGRQHSGGVMSYLSSPGADPFLRDCLERAEDLLERVRRNREGQGASRYEEDCRAKIDALYGHYDRALQVWDNLLTRKDVYAPPVRRQIVWTYLARRGRSWDLIPPKEVDRIVSLLEDNLQEEPDSDTNLRLWVQAVRRATYPPTIEAVIERVGYWRARTDSLESSFYLYIFYALQAIDGSSLARDSAIRFLDECRAKARFRRNRTKSFEWWGKESGVGKLVHHSQLGEWNTDSDFWENTAPLARLPGRIATIEGPQAGQVEVVADLKAFFVPAKGDYSRGRSENRAVTFFLGFSYDGLRAWEVKDT